VLPVHVKEVRFVHVKCDPRKHGRRYGDDAQVQIVKVQSVDQEIGPGLMEGICQIKEKQMSKESRNHSKANHMAVS